MNSELDFLKTGVLILNERRYNIDELTFEQVEYKGGTGRSCTTTGPGSIKSHTYRIGCTTNIGDIERSVWIELIKYMIHRDGKDELFNQLLCWEAEHNYTKMNKHDLVGHVLEIFSMRLYDDEHWCDFLPFNKRYRPDALHAVRLADVITDCCKQKCSVTQTMRDDAWRFGDVLCCPICGRYSRFIDAPLDPS